MTKYYLLFSVCGLQKDNVFDVAICFLKCFKTVAKKHKNIVLYHKDKNNSK